MKKGFRLLIILFVLLLVASGYIFTWSRQVVYIPPREQAFLDLIQQTFNQSHSPVPLRQLTTFAWDRVCLIQVFEASQHSHPPIMNKDEIETLLDIDLSNHDQKVPILEGSVELPGLPIPTPRVGLLFIQNREIVERLC